jgi:hypothetical protein
MIAFNFCFFSNPVVYKPFKEYWLIDGKATIKSKGVTKAQYLKAIEDGDEAEKRFSFRTQIVVE